MAKVLPFEMDHFRKLKFQAAQEYTRGFLREEDVRVLEHEDAHSFSLVDGEIVLGCAGVIPIWPHRAAVWAMIAGEARGRKFILVDKAVRRFLATCYINRIEATVDCNFPEGHRWMQSLGFKLEAERMRGYRPDGGDCALYARVLS
jgi:hypothetical protein